MDEPFTVIPLRTNCVVHFRNPTVSFRSIIARIEIGYNIRVSRVRKLRTSQGQIPSVFFCLEIHVRIIVLYCLSDCLNLGLVFFNDKADSGYLLFNVELLQNILEVEYNSFFVVCIESDFHRFSSWQQ